MLMKKTILLLITIMTAIAANAQLNLINIGVRGGVTMEHTKLWDSGMKDFDLSAGSRAGFHVGLVGRVNLMMFHIQPEIIYSRTGYTLDYGYMETPDVRRMDDTKIHMNTLDMPVLLGLRFLWFRLQAGPVFSLMTDASVKNKDLIKDLDVSRPAVTYMAGIGFDIGKLNLDVRYHGQFNRTKNKIDFNQLGMGSGNKYKSSANHWQFSVGYMF